jgi:hypothetical protein
VHITSTSFCTVLSQRSHPNRYSRKKKKGIRVVLGCMDQSREVMGVSGSEDCMDRYQTRPGDERREVRDNSQFFNQRDWKKPR